MRQYRNTPYYFTEEGKCFRNNKPIKGYKNTKGYVKIEIWENNVRTQQLSLHRIVGELYLENPENKPQINHKDGNKTNNHVSNLEWVTQSQNIQHRLDVLQVGMDSDHSSTKIPAKEIKILRVMRRLGIPISINETSKKWGIRRDYLYKVINGTERKRV